MVRVTAAMERLTVHRASYPPVPLPACCRWKPPVYTKPSVAVEKDTVHQLTYRPRDWQDPIKSSPPRDHGFLDGDGQSRFQCTSYQSDYPAKTGPVGNNNITKDVHKVKFPTLRAQEGNFKNNFRTTVR